MCDDSHDEVRGNRLLAAMEAASLTRIVPR
jgi:hypothetical protein